MRRADALDRAGAHVADREDAGHAGLERRRRRPSPRRSTKPLSSTVTSQSFSHSVVGIGAEEQEHVADRARLLLSPLSRWRQVTDSTPDAAAPSSVDDLGAACAARCWAIAAMRSIRYFDMLAARPCAAHQHPDLRRVRRRETPRPVPRSCRRRRAPLPAPRTCFASIGEAQYQTPCPSIACEVASSRDGDSARRRDDHRAAADRAPVVEAYSASGSPLFGRSQSRRDDVGGDQHASRRTSAPACTRARRAPGPRCRSGKPR